METPAVEVSNMTKVFRAGLRKQYVVAVEALSFRVEEGEVYGLIGPNGSGKSTTMKVVLGLMAPSRGSSRVFGIDSRRVGSRRDVGFLPENPYFYKHLTGRETLRFYGRLCGMRGRELADRIAELLDLVDLVKAGDRRLGGYSKGMLQRIGLAQAIIQRPRLVILDEPTAGVDPQGSRQIRDLVLALKEEGISVLLCSHLLEQVQEVCDRVGILFDGHLRRQGRLDELVAIEEQTELIVEGASEELLQSLEEKIEEAKGATLVRRGHPRSSLERLFLEELRQETEERARRSGRGMGDGDREPNRPRGTESDTDGKEDPS